MHFARPLSAPPTNVQVQSKDLTTGSHSAAASPPNFKINHCKRRRLPSLSARALHPYEQLQLASQRSNAFGSFVGRVLVNHSFIKLLLQRSSSRQQNHVPCMQGVISDLFYYSILVFLTLVFIVTLRELFLNWCFPAIIQNLTSAHTATSPCSHRQIPSPGRAPASHTLVNRWVLWLLTPFLL